MVTAHVGAVEPDALHLGEKVSRPGVGQANGVDVAAWSVASVDRLPIAGSSSHTDALRCYYANGRDFGEALDEALDEVLGGVSEEVREKVRDRVRDEISDQMNRDP